MTKDEWVELVTWVDDRWASRTWDSEQARVFYDDLKGLDGADVWAALYKLYNEGREYPPTGSVLVAAAIDTQVLRLRAEAAKTPAVLAATGDTSWKAWRDKIGYPGLTMNQAVKRSHKQRFPKGCQRFGCDVCVKAEA